MKSMRQVSRSIAETKWLLNTGTAQGSWNFSIHMTKQCIVCQKEQNAVLDFKFYDLTICMKCLEHMFATTTNISKSAIEEMLKTNKLERIKAKEHRNALKQEKMNLKNKLKKYDETTQIALADIKITTIEKLYTSVQGNYQWRFNGQIQCVFSKWNGTCLSCNRNKIITIYISTESHFSLCLDCIRSVQAASKPTREELELKAANLAAELKATEAALMSLD